MQGAGPELSLDDRFLLAVALKNGLLTRDAAEEAIRRRAALAAEGLEYSLEAVLVRDELLDPDSIARIRRAQAATHARRLDALYADTARRMRAVDERRLARVLDERRRSPRLDRIGDALVDAGAIDPADHARVLREMRRAIASGEEAYVTGLRERVGEEKAPAPSESGRAPRAAASPPPAPPPPAPRPAAPPATPVAAKARPSTPTKAQPPPKVAPPLDESVLALDSEPSRDGARATDDDGDAPEDWLGQSSIDAPPPGQRVQPSDEDLLESAERALPVVVGKAKKRKKALSARDLRELDESISKADLPSARARRRPAGLAAGVAIAVLLGGGALVAALTSGDGGERAAREERRAERPREAASEGASSEAEPAPPSAGEPPVATPGNLGSLPAPPEERRAVPEVVAGPSASRESAPTAAAAIEAPRGPDAAAYQRLFNRGQAAEKAGRAADALAAYRAALAAAEPGSARAVLVKLRADACERALAANQAQAARAEELWAHAIEALRAGRAIEALTPLDTLASFHRDERAAKAATFARELGDMAFIPGGSFVMGTDEADIPHAQPPHEVSTAAYFIDREETTNALYRAFAEATGAERPATWIAPGRNPLPGEEEHPVSGISFEEATRFAAWRGKRLPTEVEWERAARGTDRRRFPWGAGGGARANTGAGVGTTEPGDVGTRPVGTSAGDVSAAGCLDMGGNVAEWTASPFLPYPGGDPKVADFSDAFRVVRGGSWRYEPSYARCAWRDRARPGERFPEVGFRCARDVPEFLPELK